MAEYTRQEFGVAMTELDEAWRLLTPTVPFSETMVLWPAAKMLGSGQDPLAQFLDDLHKQNRSSPLLRSSLPSDIGSDTWVRAAEQLTAARREGYVRGKAIVDELGRRAKKNAGLFEYWLEAADAATFYADFALALLRGTLKREAPSLVQRITSLRECARRLWERTYTAGSVEDELHIRYGFHESCLRGAGADQLKRLTSSAQG